MTRSVNRALDLLEVVRDAPQPVTLNELAQAASMDKATAMRLARDLVARQYLEQLPGSKRYALGLSVLELANRLWDHDSVTQNTLRYLEDLRDRTMQTVALCSLSGQHYVVTLELPSLEPIKFSQGVGTTRSLTADAAGLAMLAFGQESRLPPGADGSSFQRVRDEGYAYSVSSTIPRVASVAAPVLREGRAAAAVCLSWILDGQDAETIARRRYSAQVIACAQRLSRLRHAPRDVKSRDIK